MPIYQYKCEKCAAEFEQRKSFNEESNHVTCPECGKRAHRVFCAPGIIFKGSGFYVTDYKSNATIPSASKEKVKKDIAEVTKPASSTEIPS